MQSENVGKAADDNHNDKSVNERRRRVNRMKTAIIIIVIILIILPTICCILLGFKVSRLQKQVNGLYLQNVSSDLSKDMALDGEAYAYAAERSLTEQTGIDDQADLTIDDEFNSTDTAIYEVEMAASDSIVHNLENNIIDQNTDSTKDDNPNKNSIVEETQPENEIKISNKGIYTGKKVYLTFDDGPSAYTEDILDILAKYQVKATFFVVGKTDKFSKKMYQRIVAEGHTLGMHSYSHIYKNIYNSVEDFDKDFTKLWELLYDTTGYRPTIFRFPGGSANQVNDNGMDDFIRYLNDKSIVYYDWNALNGDATGVEYTKEQLIDNVLDGVSIKKTSIVLMHDSETKRITRDSITELLETLISEGAEILPLDKDVKPIQQIKCESIK